MNTSSGCNSKGQSMDWSNQLKRFGTQLSKRSKAWDTNKARLILASTSKIDGKGWHYGYYGSTTAWYVARRTMPSKEGKSSCSTLAVMIKESLKNMSDERSIKSGKNEQSRDATGQHMQLQQWISFTKWEEVKNTSRTRIRFATFWKRKSWQCRLKINLSIEKVLASLCTAHDARDRKGSTLYESWREPCISPDYNTWKQCIKWWTTRLIAMIELDLNNGFFVLIGTPTEVTYMTQCEAVHSVCQWFY